MSRGAVLIGLYVVAVILPLWLATWLSSEAEGLVYDVGRNLGLAGFMIQILQFVLAARIKWIERAFSPPSKTGTSSPEKEILTPRY